MKNIIRSIVVLMIISILLGIVFPANFAKASAPVSSNKQSSSDVIVGRSLNLSVPRDRLVAATAGSKILFAGGHYSSGQPFYTSVVDIFDFSNLDPRTHNPLKTTENLSLPRANLAAASVGSKAFFAGGTSNSYPPGDFSTDRIDIYDGSTNTWSTAALSIPRSNLVGVSLGENVYFAGGAGNGFSDRVDIYDSLSQTWQTTSLSLGRQNLAAAALNDLVLFAGGDMGDGNHTTDRVDIYNAITRSWSTASLSQPRTSLAAGSAGGKIVFAGGLSGGTRSDIVDIYDIATDTWSVAHLFQARSNIATVSAGGKIFFAGGFNNSFEYPYVSPIVDVYDAENDSWSHHTIQGRMGMAGASLGYMVFFAGGYGNTGVCCTQGLSTNIDRFNITSLNKPPTAVAGADQEIEIGTTVTFNGSNSFDPDLGGYISDYSWNFGDGTTTTSKFAAHTFTQVGVYTITLSVTDDLGSSSLPDTLIITVKPANHLPVASAGPDMNAEEGSSINFSGSESTDPDGMEDIVSYVWDFGDGAVESGALVNHVYVDNGVYTVSLAVTDTQGAIGNDIAVVNINNVAPAINLDVEGAIEEGMSLTGSGSFIDPGMDNWTATVDYGDGSGVQPLVLEEKTFSLNHVYYDSGIYTLTVEVRDDDLATTSETITITVAEATTTVGRKVISIASGFSHNCAITEDGNVKCWGNNRSGQLGNGTTVSSNIPVLISGLSEQIVSIDASTHTTCAVTSMGKVYCWGSGELGNGSQFSSTIPIEVSGLNGGVAKISIGEEHACVLMISGGVKCWGNNRSGQLGDGTQTNQSTPVDVIGLTNDIVDIEVGLSVSYAITTNGEVRAWGYNGNGLLLVNCSGVICSTPKNVTSLGSGIKSIAAGRLHVCALYDIGDIKCWGKNDYGQLGNGQTLPTYTMVPVNVIGLNSSAVAIKAGVYHTCAIIDNGSVKCWGMNRSGQIGTDSTADSNIPVNVRGLNNAIVSLGLGEAHTCALDEIDDVKCWGDSSNGQLGNDTFTSSSMPEDVVGWSGPIIFRKTFPTNKEAVDPLNVTLQWSDNGDENSYEYCYDTINNNLCDASWTKTGSERFVSLINLLAGTKYYWQVRSEDVVNPVFANDNIWWSFNTYPTPMINATIAGGGKHTCAITRSGGVKCWGNNDWGQLGNGTNNISLVPIDVIGLSGTVTEISANYNFTCALNSQGGVQCWGYNGSGQLGNGTTLTSNIPVDVFGLQSGVISISTGSSHACAVTQNGELKCWGSNSQGQLGSGSTASTNIPVTVVGLNSKVKAVVTGAMHTCGLTEDGGVKCWGVQDFGILGNGVTSSAIKTTPTDVIGLNTGVIAIDAGNLFTCALTNSGRVKCWGANFSGQLGNSTTSSTSIPATVSELDNVVDISTGYSHACASRVTGGLVCWGSNNQGMLGNGTRTNSWEPISVVGLEERIVEFEADFDQTCAKVSSGKLKCWGANSYGQLGNNTLADGLVPTDVFGWGGPELFNKSTPIHEAEDVVVSPVLTWGSGEDADNYEYCYDTTGDDSCNNGWLSSGTATSVALSDLIPGTTYFWQIRAHNFISTSYADNNKWFKFTVGFPENVAPEVNPGGPYSVFELQQITLHAEGSDAEGDEITYSWDLNGDDIFETPGQDITFSAANLDGPSTQPVKVKACDSSNACSISATDIQIVNAAPTADIGCGTLCGFNFEGSSPYVGFGLPVDSPADIAEEFTYYFDCMSDGEFEISNGTYPVIACVFPDSGYYTITGKIMDKDGGYTIYPYRVWVDNRPPTGTLITSTDESYEGLATQLQFIDLYDPAIADREAGYDYSYDCTNDGVWEVENTRSPYFDCVYPDSGTYNVRGNVKDKDGGYSSYLLDIEVINQSPTATFTSSYDSIVEGGRLVVFFADQYDPSIADVEGGFRYSYDCDGNGVYEVELSSSTRYSCIYADSGLYTTYGKIIDKDGDSSTYSIQIQSQNLPPTALITNSNQELSEGGSSEIGFMGQDDPSPLDQEAGFKYSFDCTNDGLFEITEATSASYTCTYEDNGVYTALGVIHDKDDGKTEYSTMVTSTNLPPSGTFTNLTNEIKEGESAVLVFDNPIDAGLRDIAAGLKYSFDCTNDGLFEVIDATQPTFTCDYPDSGLFTAVGEIKDKDGGVSTYTIEISVANIPPVIENIVVPVDPIQVGEVVNILASFYDPGVKDTFRIRWSWGDGTTTEENANSLEITSSHVYNSPGVYIISLNVEDSDGGSESKDSQYLVIYDPNGGSVMGNGTIDTPTGAYLLDPELSGTADFGFQSKYKKGAKIPEGNTKFSFKTGKFKFDSKFYDWLVVAGKKVQFKGVGTIEIDKIPLAGDFGFLLTAIDGDLNGGDRMDKFRIKIWDLSTEAIIYDNQLGERDDIEPTTVITHGSIKILK